MCARLLSCPLCSQPSFSSLDSLRSGLVSVATRPLSCPVCDDVLLGVDKLTIHLFGHTIDGSGSNARNSSSGQLSLECVASGLVRSARKQLQSTDSSPYVPVQDVGGLRGFRSVNTENSQNATTETGQVIFRQNIAPQSNVYSVDPVNEDDHLGGRTSQIPQADSRMLLSITNEVEPINQTLTVTNQNHMSGIEICESVAQSNDVANFNDDTDDVMDSHQILPKTQVRWSKAPANITDHSAPPDRLAALVEDAQITSPLQDRQTVEHSSIEDPVQDESINKPITRSSRALSVSELTERCNICGCHFADQSILVLHKQLVHSIPDRSSSLESLLKSYPCHLCSKSFKMRGSLMVHMRVAHPSCNPLVSKGRGQNKTEDQQKKPEVIEHLFTQHVKTHETKQWECDVCSKSFTTKHFLKKHKRLHSGETPYKCDLCDKTFTFQQSFHKHRLYHKDDKPHACTTCGRSFKELSTLHNHERIHTGEKPFACETCGKCFRQRVSYLVHQRIHTGLMPYKCSSCGKNFRYKVSQRTHKCPNQTSETSEQQSGSSSQEPSDAQNNLNDHINPLPNENMVEEPVTAKENQYVLVLDDKGNHVLKRQIDIEKSSNQGGNQSADVEPEIQNEPIETVWNQSGSNVALPNINELDLYSHTVKDTNMWNQAPNNKEDSQNSDDSISKHFNVRELNDEFCNSLWSQTSPNQAHGKHHSDSVSDLFSMVMSPAESSPSSEMKHLSLSSPVNNLEITPENIDTFSPIGNNSNPVRVDCNNVGDILVENNVNLSTLRSINEDSLKELLYTISET